MNAAAAKPSSLVLATLMPAAAAARSFDRTARKRRPVVFRRRFTAAAHASMATITMTMANPGFGRPSRRMMKLLLVPKEIPNSDGGDTELLPAASVRIDGFRRIIASN